MKVKNSNPHNAAENTHFTVENTCLTAKNPKLIANITEIKQLTCFNKLNLDNVTKATILESPAMVYLLLSKVKKSIKLTNSPEFTNNKDNKTINIKD